MGARLPNIPVPQSSDQKTAINPAKRVEVIDELHFDNVAEWDAYLKGLKEMDAEELFKHEETLRALEQRVDLAPLIQAAEGGVWEACWKLWHIAKNVTEALNNIAKKQPELFRPLVRRCFEWPGLISRNREVSEDNQRFLEKLQQGEDFPFANIPKGKSGRTLKFKDRANNWAFTLYATIEYGRGSYGYFKYQVEQYGHKLPSWLQDAVNLEAFSEGTLPKWAEKAYRVLDENSPLGKLENHPDLRPLGESAGRKKPKYCKKIHKGTRDSNVRAKIKERIYGAMKKFAKGGISSPVN